MLFISSQWLSTNEGNGLIGVGSRLEKYLNVYKFSTSVRLYCAVLGFDNYI